MVKTTQTPEQDDLSRARNPGQSDFDKIIDRNISPGDEKMMEERAKQGADDDFASKEADAADNASQTNDPDLEHRESQGDNNWVNNTGTEESNQFTAGDRVRAFFRRKKNRGIIAFIIACVTIMGFMFSLLSGALGLVNLKETIFTKLSSRAENAVTHRVNRVLAKKMNQELTAGCGIVKVKCRYRGMTNREVKKFNKRGMAHGVKVLTEPSLIPGRQKVVGIARYEPVNGASVGSKGEVEGKITKTYGPTETYKAMRGGDPFVAKAAVAFFKSNVQYHSGNVARGVFSHFKVYLGKRNVDPAEGSTDAEKARAQQSQFEDQTQSQTDKGFSSASQKKIDALDESVRHAIDTRGDELEEAKNDPSKRVGTPSPGTDSYDNTFDGATQAVENAKPDVVTGYLNPVADVVFNYCTLRTLVIAVNSVRKIEATGMIFSYGMAFFTLADRVKAGDADGDSAETIGAAMGILTAKDKNGLTAFDSAGYNWISNGSVRPGIDEDITKFQNGGSASGLLGGAVKGTTSGLGPICRIANSKWVTAAMGFAEIASLLAGAFTGGTATGAYQALKQTGVAGGKVYAKKLIKETVEEGVAKTVKRKLSEKVAGKSTGSVVWDVMKSRAARVGYVGAFFYFGVPPLIESLGRASSNTTVKGLVGVDPGNAVVSAGTIENAKISQAQGLEPISADEAVQQDVLGVDGGLKQANLEGINQLDASNPRSFTNKFAISLLPSMAKFSSTSSAGSGISSIFSSALSSTFGRANADSTQKLQYEYCEDESYAKANIATDIFCSPQYGFDMAVIDGEEYDPEKVVDYVYANGLVDEEGEPTGELSDFISRCMEADTSVGQDEEGDVEGDCIKRDTQHRMMRLYCLDSSIDSDMKEETSGNCSTHDENTNTSGSSPVSDSTEVSQDASENASKLLDFEKSGKIKLDGYSEDPSSDKNDRSLPSLQLEDIAGGKKANLSTRCSYASSLSRSVSPDPKILQFLVDLAGKTKYTINTLFGQCHSGPGSNHHQGKAVDFSCDLNTGTADNVGEEYGVSRNPETCAANSHWHYSVGGN